jgi:hypothetical protein
MAPKTAGKARARSSAGNPENLKKRPASVSTDCEQRNNKKKCKSIISAMVGVEELPPKVRETLSGLVSPSLCSDNALPPQYRHAAITLVREALVSTEKRLEEERRAAQEKVDGAQEDKAAREAAVVDAEIHLHGLKNTIAESKIAIKESTTSMSTSRKSLKAVQGAQKSSQDKLSTIAAKVEQLHTVEKNVYQPLKGAAAQGRKGQEHLKRIRKLGKDFGFQEALLESVPGVLKKSLDRRRTFDGFVISQLEREFKKNYTEMEGKLQQGEEELHENTNSVQETQALLDESGQSLEESNHKLFKASLAVSPCKKTLVQAKQHVRKFESDVQKYERDLKLAQARLDAFRSGPLDAFKELQKRTLDLLPVGCDPKRAAVSSETDNVSSAVCCKLAQPLTSHLDVTASQKPLPELLPETGDGERTALPRQTDNVSSSCSTLAQLSASHHDVSVSLATTIPWSGE